MMNSRIAVVTVALSVMATAACFGANPHVGTWKVNESKSKEGMDMGKTNTVTYAEKKDQLQVTVDGKAYKAKGNLAWDMMAYKAAGDRAYDITAMKGGKVTWTGRSTVSADGKSRTLNISGTGADGKKFKAKIVYDKA